jgi:hypothetical protein
MTEPTPIYSEETKEYFRRLFGDSEYRQILGHALVKIFLLGFVAGAVSLALLLLVIL